MMKKMMIALLAIVMVVGANLRAEEEAAKCNCGDACEKESCCCANMPEAVKEAAMKAVEGLKVVCMHVKKTDAGATYMVKGMVGDKKVVVTVTTDAEGKVTSTKAPEAKEGHEGHEGHE